MTREQPVTAVENALHRRWRLLIPVYIFLAIIALIGIIGTVLGPRPPLATGAEPDAVLRRHCRGIQIRFDRRRAA